MVVIPMFDNPDTGKRTCLFLHMVNNGRNFKDSLTRGT